MFGLADLGDAPIELHLPVRPRRARPDEGR
jgi:hypothetical protein